GLVEIVFIEGLLLLYRDALQVLGRNTLLNQFAVELLVDERQGFVEQGGQAVTARLCGRLQLGFREIVAVAGAVVVKATQRFRLEAAVRLHDEIGPHVEHGLLISHGQLPAEVGVERSALYRRLPREEASPAGG